MPTVTYEPPTIVEIDPDTLDPEVLAELHRKAAEQTD